MAYPPRLLQPDAIHFITSRTIEGTFFLRPSAELNRIVGAILAAAQRRYGVELFDFVFLSNHMHLAVRSRRGQIPAFMQYLKANIATNVNRLHGRHGPFWERRYAASPILDEGAQIERAIYIYGHGVKEGLVEHSYAWPGIASVKERLHDRSTTDRRSHRTDKSRRPCGRQERRCTADSSHDVQVALSTWPFLAETSPGAQRRRVAALVDDAERQGRATRSCRRPLGARAVLAQDPRDRPRSELERKPNPLCHARNPKLRDRYRRDYSLFLDAYWQASRRFRDGDPTTVFPPHSFPPPLPRGWVKTAARARAPTASRAAHQPN